MRILRQFTNKDPEKSTELTWTKEEKKRSKAFLEKQKEIAYEDISRTQNQKHWANIKADMASLAEGRRGRNARTASLFKAAGTLYNGYENYKDAQ